MALLAVFVQLNPEYKGKVIQKTEFMCTKVYIQIIQ